MMNNIRYILAVAGKELQVISKDRGSLAVLFLLPLLLSSLLGSAGNAFAGADGEEGSSISIDAVLVNQDEGMYGQQIALALEDIEQLSLQKVALASDADSLVADGEAIGAIIIPADFSQKIDQYQPVTIQLIVDPTREQGGDIIAGIINQVADEITVVGEISYGIRSVFLESGVLDSAPPELQKASEAQALGAILSQLQTMRQSPLITVSSEDLEGVESEQFDIFGYYVPNFAVLFAFVLIAVIASTILREKEEGSFRRLVAAPISRSAIIGGKMLAYMTVIVLQVVVLFSVGNIAFGMPLGESALGLLIMTIALALSASALGLLLATLSKSSSQADTAGTVLSISLGGLGGCIVRFPPDSFMGKLSLAIPHGHALKAFHGLLNFGDGVVDILPEAAAVLGFAAVFFLLAVWRFRFE